MDKLNKYLPKVWWGNLLLVLVALLLAYALGSRALDTGSWWEYLGALIMVVLAGRFFVQIFQTKS